MKQAKNNIMENNSFKTLKKQQADSAIREFEQLMKKSPDLENGSPIDAVAWLESIIALYKKYEKML